MKNEKHPQPDRSINNHPEQNPNKHPSTGQPEPDIQDERSKDKHGSRPHKKDYINPEKIRENGNPREYNDGDPVEEKSPRISNSL